jgi:hypothetical protein
MQHKFKLKLYKTNTKQVINMRTMETTVMTFMAYA